MALVFVRLHLVGDPADRLRRESPGRDFLGGQLLFDIEPQDFVEHLVRRKCVLVLLVRPQFRAGRLVDRVARDDLAVPVDVAGQLIDHHFGHIGNEGHAAGHVAVDRAITDGQFAFVAGGNDHAVELVGQRHECHTPQAGLQIFLGHVRRVSGENRRELFFHRLESAADRHGAAFDAELPGQPDRIVDAALGREGSGHGHAKHIVLAQGRDGQGGGDRRINAAAQADDDLFETAFAEVVAEPEDKGIMDVGHIGVFGRRKRNRGRNGDQRVDFAEAGQFGGKVAVGREGERVPVEDKLVIAADQIGVNQGHLEPLGDGAEHGASFDRFARFERRGAQVEQEVDAGPGQFVERAAAVKVTRQIFRGPQIFADRDPGPAPGNVG